MATCFFKASHALAVSRSLTFSFVFECKNTGVHGRHNPFDAAFLPNGEIINGRLLRRTWRSVLPGTTQWRYTAGMLE